MRFGRNDALAGVSLSVAAGEVHALIGRNGAGKTTLLRTTAGLQLPAHGDVRVLGVKADLTNRAWCGRIGWVVSGDRTFYLRVSGLENLLFFARLHGIPKTEARRRALACLDAVGLADAATVRVGLYSRGMQKRLSVARGLLTEPEVLLLDEATHDVDPDGGRRIRALVRAAADRGAAVLWATQQLDEIAGFADRVTVLDRGRVLFEGSVDELVAQSGTRTFLLSLARRGTRRAPGLAAVKAAVDPIAIVASGASRGAYAMTLRDGAILGDALAALAAAGFAVHDCREERSPVETALLALSLEGTLAGEP